MTEREVPSVHWCDGESCFCECHVTPYGPWPCQGCGCFPLSGVHINGTVTFSDGTRWTPEAGHVRAVSTNGTDAG